MSPLESMLHEEDLACIIHCSIPSPQHRVLLSIILKALPTLSSVYLLIPFPLNRIVVFKFQELIKLTLLSKLLYIQFFNLANTYLSLLKYARPTFLLVCVSGGCPRRQQSKMSLSVDLYQIVICFLFLFSTFNFLIEFLLSSYKAVKSPEIKSTRVKQQQKQSLFASSRRVGLKVDYPAF